MKQYTQIKGGILFFLLWGQAIGGIHLNAFSTSLSTGANETVSVFQTQREHNPIVCIEWHLKAQAIVQLKSQDFIVMDIIMKEDRGIYLKINIHNDSMVNRLTKGSLRMQHHSVLCTIC